MNILNASQNILTIPNPILTQKALPVIDFTGMDALADAMRQTAVQNNLVGLAGNQVGILQRIFVLNFGANKTGENSTVNFVTFINPVIQFYPEHGKEWLYEGCASIPGREAMIERCKIVDVMAQNVHGNEFSLRLTGFHARIAQHENDHLNGILFTSHRMRGLRAIKASTPEI